MGGIKDLEDEKKDMAERCFYSTGMGSFLVLGERPQGKRKTF